MCVAAGGQLQVYIQVYIQESQKPKDEAQSKHDPTKLCTANRNVSHKTMQLRVFAACGLFMYSCNRRHKVNVVPTKCHHLHFCLKDSAFVCCWCMRCQTRQIAYGKQ
jgi:hypothetical protein